MNREKFLESIIKVKPGTSPSSSIEQSNLIQIKKDEIISYNDEIMIVSKMKEDIGVSGVFPAKELIELLTKMTDEEIELENKDHALFITGKKIKAELNSINIVFPEIEKVSSNWKKLSEDFLIGINLCKFSTSKDNSSIFQSIYISKNKMFSSDNYRITEYVLSEEMDQFLLPSHIVSSLISFTPTKYCIDKNWIFFLDKDGSMFCVSIKKEQFPNMDSVTSNIKKGKKISLPNQLKDSLLRTKILSGEDVITGNRTVEISIKNNKLFCHGECDKGKVDEVIKIDYPDKMEIKFNIVPDFLCEIMNKTQDIYIGKDVLVFEFDNFKHFIKL